MIHVTDAYVSLYQVVVKDKKLVVQEVRFDSLPDNTMPNVFIKVPHNLSRVAGGYFFDLQTAQDSIMAVFRASVLNWNRKIAEKN